jgi:hypothetical protein
MAKNIKDSWQQMAGRRAAEFDLFDQNVESILTFID